MCLIIHREVNGKRGPNVPNAILDANRRSNPDGFGLAWRDKDGLHYEKFAPADFESFRDLLKRVDRDVTVEYVAHFRKATHGKPCKELSHPFTYTDDEEGEVLVFHNGIISIPGVPREESDTSYYVKKVLAVLPNQWWTSPSLRWVVEESIGWSRLLVMSKSGTVRLNQRSWEKHGGLWYSTRPSGLSTGASWAVSGKGRESASTDVRYFGWRGEDAASCAVSTYDEDDEEEGTLLAGLGTVAASRNGEWFSMGHHVTPVETESEEMGDSFGTAICDECRTTGEFYVIDGKVYLDVPHLERARVLALAD